MNEVLLSPKPKISVIIPVYNAEKYLKETIDSILVQSFQEFELILVNDGSVDNSQEVIDYYVNKDKRIKTIQQLNMGAPNARNKGADISEGEYFYFFDADDLMLPDALKNMYPGDHSDVDLVFGRIIEVDSKGAILKGMTSGCGKCGHPREGRIHL